MEPRKADFARIFIYLQIVYQIVYHKTVKNFNAIEALHNNNHPVLIPSYCF